MAPEPSERPVQWTFPLTEVTQNKRMALPGTPREDAYALVGVDGAEEGGLSPHPGFVPVLKLDAHASHPDHDFSIINRNSQVIDLFGFQIKQGSADFGFGFIYRVAKGVLSDIFIQYWSTKTSNTINKAVVAEDLDVVAKMDVAVSGRLGYIAVQGRSPIRFMLNDSTGALELLGDNPSGPFPGPGGQPLFKGPVDAATAVGTLAETSTEVPAVAQIFVADLAHQTENWQHWDPEGGPAGTCNQLYPNWVDPTGDIFARYGSKVPFLRAGGYSFAFQLQNSTTGLVSNLSEVVTLKEDDFGPISSDPTNPVYGQVGIEMNYDSSLYDQIAVYRSVRVEAAGGTFVNNILLLDSVTQLSKIHTCRNGTGQDFDPASTDWRNVVYYFELEDGQLANQDEYNDNRLFDEKMPSAGVLFNYEGTLFASGIRTADPTSSAKITFQDTLRGLGEMRWSSPANNMPELFSPSSRFVPRLSGNEIIEIAEAAGNAIGFSLDRQYHIRREGTFVRVEEMHSGFGCVGARAVETVGSTVYFLNEKGLKAVDAQGQLDDIRALTWLVSNEWRGDDLSLVSMAYDSALACLHMLNPTRSEMVCIWFSTAKITQIEDAPFSMTVRGFWPSSAPFSMTGAPSIDMTVSPPLTERAFFLKNPTETYSDEQRREDPILYVVDKNHASLKTSGEVRGALQRRIRTIHYAGDSSFTVSSVGSNTVTVSGGTSMTGMVYGVKVYVGKSQDRSIEGKWMTLVEVNSNVFTFSFDEDFSDFNKLVAGDTLLVSPMIFRWVGSPVGPIDDMGQELGFKDYFRLKQIDSINCSFTDTSGWLVTQQNPAAAFCGLVFSGAEVDTPAAKSFPRSPSTVSKIFSLWSNESRAAASFAAPGSTTVANGQYGASGTTLSPGVEILCSDIFFRLLGVRVTGKLLGTYRSHRGPS